MTVRGIDDRSFFTSMALAALAVVFVGFATSYYLWPITRATHLPTGRPISPSFPLIVHLHAAGFSAWILLLLAQVRLVAVGRTDLHTRIGLVAACLAPFLVVTGLMTAVHGARGGWTPPGGPLSMRSVSWSFRSGTLSSFPRLSSRASPSAVGRTSTNG
jgi:hypothetical protein